MREMEMEEREQRFDSGMHKHLDAFSWNESAKMGIAAGVASGVVTAVAYFGVKSILAFGNAFPVIKGSIPAAVIMAPTYALAHNLLSNKKHGLRKKQRNLYSMVIAAALGTVLTPTLSSFMLKKKVGYIASAGYSLAPIAALFLNKVLGEPLLDIAAFTGSSHREELY
jgi:drug/metabolite transporter (DMT)-like permease